MKNNDINYFKSTQLMVLSALLAMTFAVKAQILIGQTAGYTGAVSGSVKEAGDGARLYLDFVNLRGGVLGQKIDLISMDDKFDPKLAASNAKVLLEEKKVLALFLSRGTPHTEAILPLLEQNQAVLVAPSTGAMSLHQPIQKYVYNVRTSYQAEAARAVQHLKTLGSTRIGIIYRDDSFGEDGLAGVQKTLTTLKLAAVMVEKYDRKTPDLSKAVAQAVKSDVQAVLFIGGGSEVVAGVKALRAAGSRVSVVSLSNNASLGFAKELAEFAQGVIVMQVFPAERDTKYALSRELMQMAANAGVKELSPAMMEGFAGAKVLVEAIRRASPRPTREKIRIALEGMKDFDLGGLNVAFSAADHTGLSFVDISILTSDGKFRR